MNEGLTKTKLEEESIVELEMLDRCPICGHDEIPPAYQRNYPNGYELMIAFCTRCHIIFNNPRLSDEYNKRYYGGLYRDTVAPNIDGVNDLDFEVHINRSKLQVEMIKPMIEGMTSALEIGSYTGRLLEELQQAGIEKLVGVEPDTRFHEVEPANMFDCVPDIADVKPYPYDLICMSHSLEHLNHPLEYIRNLVYNYAGKGTRFMIEVPNTEYYQCFGLQHPFNYTPETLNGLFVRAGCKVINNMTHGMDTKMVFRFLVGIYEV